jgi:transposase
MTAVLDELGQTALVTSITGLSPVGAAAILAETGDPQPHHRYAGQTTDVAPTKPLTVKRPR